MRQRSIGLLSSAVIVLCCVLLSVCNLTPKDTSRLRPYPYPYQAMLTLQSHIDGTTLEEFEAVHTYLNTTEETPYGTGLGLDVGDSLWMYNANDGVGYMADDDPSSYMTWFVGTDTTTENKADAIKKYWDMGWIDSIHSFGDFSRVDNTALCTRDLAKTAWETLTAAGIVPTVWINHGTETNKQNFGGYTPITSTRYQAGDDPASRFYHTDITVAGGMKFVWNSRNSHLFSMDNPLYLTRLRDGQLVWCFNAYTGNRTDEGFAYLWSPYDLQYVLTEENLATLVSDGGYAVIANHFGSGELWEMLNERNVEALNRLKQYETDGKIMVVRSSRLLQYAALRECIRYTADGDRINVTCVDDPVSGKYVPTPDDLHGITFYVTDSSAAEITIDGEPVEEKYLVRHEADETGKESIGFKWYE